MPVFDSKQPLWLPPGSIRAIAFIVVGAAWISATFFLTDDARVEQLSKAAFAIGAFYFGSRASPIKPPETQPDRGEST